MTIRVRPEEERDFAAVHRLHEAAFGTTAEADLVEVLREQAAPVVSLVAEGDQRVVGHILFAPVTLADHPECRLMGLAPLAVLPSYQHRGIGSALVRAGLAACRTLGFGGVVVLGHPDYYPRFGFSPASAFGLACEFEAPDAAFMALELVPGGLRDVSGTVHFHPAFREL